MTHIGTLHEKGQQDPWIIAMDANPHRYPSSLTACAGGENTCSRTARAVALVSCKALSRTPNALNGSLWV